MLRTQCFRCAPPRPGHANLADRVLRVLRVLRALQEDLQRCETARAAEEESKQSIERKLELLAESIDVMEEEHAAEQRNYSRITSDPDRIKKQSAVVLKATDTLVQESERVEARMNEVDGAADRTVC